MPDISSIATARPAYSNAGLLQIAMPMGGLGAGCICLNGQGGLQDFSILGCPSTSAVPDGHHFTEAAFALLHIKGVSPTTKLLEGPMPVEKMYDQGLKGQGFRQGGYEGLPRFESCSFENGFPFGRVHLEDKSLPLKASVTGWNPFIPLDDVSSGLPCALLEYTLENTSASPVEFEFSVHLSHLAHGGQWGKTRNAIIEDDAGNGVFFSNTFAPDDEKFGSAALSIIGHPVQVKAMWFRGGWFDPISVLWREVSSGQFRPNDGQNGAGEDGLNGGSLLVCGSLAPGDTITYPVVIAWHFPNSNQTYDCATNEDACCETGSACGAEPAPLWRPFYAGKWDDARTVSLYVARNYDSLRSRTAAFAEALYASSLPVDVLDAVASNLAILKSPTVLRQENGNIWGWEGCFTQNGCCTGSCTHVWNYAQSLPHLFPALERTLREQELERSLDERGHVTFRAALPDGPTNHGYHAAADGQLGGILKLLRDYDISGDEQWLRRLYPHAKQSLDYCIETWDTERRGGLFEPHHNTYDIEFWGADGMCGSIYVAALSAFAQMAHALDKPEDAAPYEELARRGAELMDETLFNGHYYAQNVQWQGLRDTSIVRQIAGVDGSSSEALQLLKAEGPKYQYGSGCLSDGVIGAWMAKIYGAPTPLLRANIRATLRAIFKHNFKADLFDHVCTQRPGYAWGHEAGLLLCTWPRGDKPTLPFVYCDEVWTGIEYQVASHLAEEGLVDEALEVVCAVRARYDGHKRNPFNEYECGNYYARAMASYALLGSLSGFRFSAVTKTLHFGPKIPGDFQTFFSTASGFGTIALEGDTLSVELIEGKLEVRKVVFERGGEVREIGWETVVQEGQTQTLNLNR